MCTSVPCCFHHPNELFLQFCDSKHTCHSYFNPLNIFYCHKKIIIMILIIIHCHFLNDEKHFTVNIDSFVSECISIHRSPYEPNYFFIFNSKTFIFIHYSFAQHNIRYVWTKLNFVPLNRTKFRNHPDINN